MCEFDESNQLCTTRYHSISHTLPYIIIIVCNLSPNLIEVEQQNSNLCEIVVSK
jgi:hypothetical protein